MSAKMSMSTWLAVATDHGLKCPQCGRFAKAKDLGWIGSNRPGMHIDAHGHLPGKGCNKRKAKR